ncbi:MAG: hypothetical protein IPL32_08110 [Chloracidobacterium sp.]|nr:hypothetical protein [Chloracidobacterium sp.]
MFLLISVAVYSASAFLFLRADTIRRATFDEWTGGGSAKSDTGKIVFGIYSTFDSRWFIEDHLALVCFVVATTALIYGVWMRKTI